MCSVKRYLSAIFTLVIVLCAQAYPAQAQRPLPPEVTTDPELTKLWEKYSYLLASKQVPLEELQKMIADEESEKARLLGIKVRVAGPMGQQQPLGISLCIRPIWGPGKVVWRFSNPGQNGAKYSVLPENGYSLIWAQPPEQNVDGIYRTSWGTCIAYKIPDSATATFYSAESGEVCYNAFACEVLGHCPKWVNPCDNNSPEGSWPDYPLQ
ncbi:MAG: hypothetical protein H5T61_10505 [Thermoflexales bacterium]|nr:hypothetical protein [Thermoflexales bacterium]